ncbi:MAG: NADH:flavin oxidoreductase/NADH oxidase [Desulfobacterales bacterium]|jgi:2,4-dienoyl-CoA reductase-like NADH-dependent reductase (Old Yellow Enzyme family)
MSSALFSPIELRGLSLNNRIAVSSMCQYAAENGSAVDWHLMHLGQFSMGAAGLVMTEATAVSPAGRITRKCLGLYSDENEAALKRVIDFCRRYGVTAMGIQLAHAGRKGSVHPPLDGGQPLAAHENPWTTLAPSAIPFGPDWHVPHGLSREDLAKVKAEFVGAAERAANIGFDLAELHGAHGYLLHQFLSPLSNQRNDEYGGKLENRMRFPLEVFAAVRAAWPDDKPLGIRISATDWIDGGWTEAESMVFAGALKSLGCDFIDVSSGGLDPRQKIPLGPGYQVPFSARIRAQAGITTWTVGMITKARQAEAVIAGGKADIVALARGMMFDPRWAWHAAEKLGVDTPYSKMYARCEPARWPQVFPWRD